MRWIRGRERERGSITLWAVTAAFAMIVLAGLAVDLGGKVHAQQHAIDVATQAASSWTRRGLCAATELKSTRRWPLPRLVPTWPLPISPALSVPAAAAP